MYKVIPDERDLIEDTLKQMVRLLLTFHWPSRGNPTLALDAQLCIILEHWLRFHPHQLLI